MSACGSQRCSVDGSTVHCDSPPDFPFLPTDVFVVVTTEPAQRLLHEDRLMRIAVNPTECAHLSALNTCARSEPGRIGSGARDVRSTI
ncbi:Hypothetical predicted protein [Pelobates cultripes]|uniref:Uncharacterized protein n=1 Tax=Pelobates cultripes TaxID=61616 RepID=A0AAD1VNY9_PELCU|nr:Hypothetical predicted protein [Pelobates cultripes]